MSLALGPARRWPEWATLGLGLSAAAAVAAVALSPALDPEVQARAALDEQRGAAEDRLRAAWSAVGAGAWAVEPPTASFESGESAGAAPSGRARAFEGVLRLGPDSVTGVLLGEALRLAAAEDGFDGARAALEEAAAQAVSEAERAAVLAMELRLAGRLTPDRAGLLLTDALGRGDVPLAPWGARLGVSALALAAAQAGPVWTGRDGGGGQLGQRLAEALDGARVPLGSGEVACVESGDGLRLVAPAGEDRLRLALERFGSPHLERWLALDLGRRGAPALGVEGELAPGYRVDFERERLFAAWEGPGLVHVRAWPLEAGLARVGAAALEPSGHVLGLRPGPHGGTALRLPGLDLDVFVRASDPARALEGAGAGLAARRRGLFALVAALVGLTGAAFLALRRTRHVAQLRAELVANVSHELRTPIASILLLAENLESGRARERPGSASYPSRIRREADRLRGLVENLLDTSRLERGKALELQLEAGPLEPLFESLVEEIGGRVRGANLEFESSGPERALSDVRHDAEALRRVVLNLAQNALAHASARRIALRLAAHSGREVALELADDGVGLTAAERRRVLQPFERGSRSKASGTGLGLAICAEIARQHGGRLELLTSEGERGVTARLVLPLVTPNEGAGGAVEQSA